jgi:Polyketide cyclase / dehydrase and lipid transport
MRADTQTISIEAPASKVTRFLSQYENLPRWAVGFAKSVRRDGDAWRVVTGQGEMDVVIHSDQDTGVVDFSMRPAPGVEVLAASRVVPRGAASEYIFTQFQAPGMPDDAFRQSVAALKHELTVLKAMLEVECPL